jgi:predicted ester cyclase
VNHNARNQIGDLESYTQTCKQLFKGAPDHHATVEDIVAEGDTVCLRCTMSGTLTGEFRGLAPTGTKYQIKAMEFLRLVNGKIIERWIVSDWFTSLKFYQQIGVVEYKGFPAEGVF